MKQVSVFKTGLYLAMAGLVGLQVACSSDSGPADASISGTIVAAPVNGAEVGVVDGSGNDVAGPVSTDANGMYTLVIPNGSLAQDLIIKSTGGTFTDEATGNSGTAGAMYAYASAGSLSNGSSVSATPGSTIIAELVMNHGKTKAEAETAFAAAFGYTPDMSVNPADATTAPAADETDDETLAGFRAGAFSQLAMDLGLSQDDQFDLFAALAQDLSDDKLDGVDASGAVAIGATGKSLEADIQNRFSTALINFKNNPNNLTGLDNNEFGDIPFAKVAFSSKSSGGTVTSSYQIEYIQTGMMSPVNGKDTFQIKVTNRNDGQVVTGLSPTLVPTMYMLGTFSHRTPMPTPAITEVGTTGVYTVTLYYLMPTAMGGYWDLNFTVNGEEAHFYPTVMMAMEGADTPQVRLKGVDDQISMMGSMVSRNYFIFKESLTGGMGTYDFSVYIATQENMMVFPAVYDNQTVSGNLIDATVEISDDDGANWNTISVVDAGNGIWNATGLSLTDGVADEIRVRLTIDDTVRVEAKTTDGTVSGNDYQTFTVTPGGM